MLIREGSPIDSFHSSHPQLETLALRCDSPKIVDTLAVAAPSADALRVSTAVSSPSSPSTPSSASQLNALLTSSDMPRDTSTRLGHHHSDLSLNNLELNFLNDEDLTANYATNYLNKSASVLKIASNLEINNWSNVANEFERVDSSVAATAATANCIEASDLVRRNRKDSFLTPADELGADSQSQDEYAKIKSDTGEVRRGCQSGAGAVVDPNFANSDTTNNNMLDNNNSCSNSCSSSSLTNNSNNNSCERLHSATKSKSVELNEFRVIFGSSPTLLNYNQVTPTSRLDAIPSQYRRGYTNLNDACMSSSTSDLPCGGSNSAGAKKSIKRTEDGISRQIGSGSIGLETTNANNSIHEISSLLRHRSDGPLDYVRSYENLDRAKIIRMKNDKRNSLSGSNYNCMHSQSSSGSGHVFGTGSGNGNNGTVDTGAGGGGNSLQDWKYNNHFDHFNDQRRIVQEEDSGDDYSYSNLGYDNAYGAVGYSIGDYQSNESLFNINFDTMDDEVFEIDAMGLFENDLAAPNTELLLEEKCTIYDAPFSNGKNATAIQMDGAKSNRLLLPDIPQACSRTDELPMYHFNSEHLVEKSNPLQPEFEVISTNAVCATSAAASVDNVDGVEAMNTSLQTIISTNSPDDVQKHKKLRCAECNKKLGLIMIMKCHCERIFCAQHRYAEAHRCSYNFKTEGQKTIARENPLVVAPKLPKI